MTMHVTVVTSKEKGARVHKLDKDGKVKETSILKRDNKQWPGSFYLWGDDKLSIEEFDDNYLTI